MKSFYIFIVAFVLLAWNVNANAQSFSVDNINYSITSAETVEVASKTYTGEVVIPESVEYEGKNYSVTAIANNAFYFCQGLTAVTIPNSVTRIGDNAFFSCIGLTEITIPNSVITFGSMAFFNCQGLTELTIPASVTTIGTQVFMGCIKLTAIHVDTDNQQFSSDNGVLLNKNQTNLIYYPAGKTGTYTFPESVSTISTNAFANCTGLTEVTLSPSLTVIRNSSFSGCTGLTKVIITNSVTGIGDYAFFNCGGITELTLPASLTTIGKETFAGCNALTSVVNKSNTPQFITDITFSQTAYANATLYVPTPAAYRTATGWKKFSNIVQTSGIDDIPANNPTIYPNPVQDELNIVNVQSSDLQFTILDLSGREIVKDELLNGRSINVSALPQGMYVVKIGPYEEKFVKK